MKINKIIDFTKVPEYVPKDQPIEPGLYNVICDQLDIGDDGVIRFRFTILEGRFERRSIPFYCHINRVELHEQYLKSMLKAIGFNDIELSEIGNNLEEFIYAVVDTKLKVKTVNREYNGKLYTNIVFYTEPDPKYTNGFNILERFKEKNKQQDQLLNKELPDLL